MFFIRCFCTLVLYMLATVVAKAQNDTTWYDAEWKRAGKASARYFRPKPVKSGSFYLITDHYADGKIQMQGKSARADTAYWEGKVVWYHPNGAIRQSATYRDNQLIDTLYTYHRNGVLESARPYRNGLFYGTVQEFDSTGLLWRELDFIEGSLRMYRMYQNNQLIVSESYTPAGQRHGASVRYSETGVLLEKETYVNGKREGIKEVFYPSGKLKERSFYVNDKLDGVSETLYESGRLKEQRFYTAGVLLGKVESFPEKEVLPESKTYKKGQPHALSALAAPNGSYQFKSFFRDRKLDSTCGWYDRNGRPIMEASLAAGVLHGPFTIQGKDNVQVVAAFHKGSLLFWNSYYPNGRPYRIGKMNVDSLVEEWTTYDEKGNKVLETAYRFDQAYGTWKRYRGNEVVFSVENQNNLLQEAIRSRKNWITYQRKKKKEEDEEDTLSATAITDEDMKNTTGEFSDITELLNKLPRRFLAAEDSVMHPADVYHLDGSGIATWWYAGGSIRFHRNFREYDSRLEVAFSVPRPDAKSLLSGLKMEEITSPDGFNLILQFENSKPSANELLIFLERPSEAVLKVMRLAVGSAVKKRLRKDPVAIAGLCYHLYEKYGPEFSLAGISYSLCTQLFDE